MRFARSAIAAGLATAATFMAAEASSSSDVLVLCSGNFTETVQNEVRTMPPALIAAAAAKRFVADLLDPLLNSP